MIKTITPELYRTLHAIPPYHKASGGAWACAAELKSGENLECCYALGYDKKLLSSEFLQQMEEDIRRRGESGGTKSPYRLIWDLDIDHVSTFCPSKYATPLSIYHQITRLGETFMGGPYCFHLTLRDDKEISIMSQMGCHFLTLPDGISWDMVVDVKPIKRENANLKYQGGDRDTNYWVFQFLIEHDIMTDSIHHSSTG